MSAQQFIAGRELQELFRDKDSGLPLSDGEIFFYEDANRLNLKPVYKYTGSPGNPSFAPLPNPLPINGSGMAEDPNNGEPVAIYYLPFDENDIVQLYYVEVYNSQNVLQNTREAWPPGFTEGTGPTNVDVNYICNPSFNLFNPNDSIKPIVFDGNLDPFPTEPFIPSRPIAYGGWSYEVTPTTTSRIVISWEALSIQPVPQGNPQYEMRVLVVNNDPSDSERDIIYTWTPENIFADSEEVTFSFWGRSGSGTAVYTLILQKDYGTGGSPTTETILTTFTLNPTSAQFTHTFSFGDESGKTKGTGENAVRLILRAPLTTATDTYFTSFILTPGTVPMPALPPITDRESMSCAVAGGAELPAGDGMNLYLPLRLTPGGIDYDDSQIGTISIYMGTDLPLGCLECNGQQLPVRNFSDDGIPYQRLFNKIGLTYGAGAQFYIAYAGGSSDTLFLVGETAGAVMPIQNGAIPVPFTFQDTHDGTTPNSNSFLTGQTRFTSPIEGLVAATAFGAPATFTGAGDSPVSVTILQDGLYNPNRAANQRFIYLLSGFSDPLANYEGKYFEIFSGDTRYYVWYQINGSGADPGAPGTGIKVDLDASDDETVLAQKTFAALRSVQIYNIEVTSGASIDPSSYFTFFSPNGTYIYHVYFIVDGVGVTPAVPGDRIAIPVSISSTDTAEQVRDAIIEEFNKQFFAVPFMEGLHIRGTSPNGEFFDPLAFTFRYNDNEFTDKQVGRIQWPMIQGHNHTYTGLGGNTSSGGPQNPGTFIANELTGTTGTVDTAPANIAVNYLIKY